MLFPHQKLISVCFIGLIVLSVTRAEAGLVPVDLLGGIGDFEYAGDTSWNVYGHPDYDFDANSAWVADYRSSIEIKDVAGRSGGSGLGDTVTVELRRSSDSFELTRTYEFTDGSGARQGNIEVNTDRVTSPASAADKLRDAIDRQQGSGGQGAVNVSVSGNTVYVKPSLNWELKAFSDSDSSDSRIESRHRTWRYGYDLAEPDDSVAVGWRRKSGENVNPGTNCVFRIAPQGMGGSNCQYVGFRGFHGPSGRIYLQSEFNVSDRLSNVHAGDTLTLKFDHIRMSEFDVPSKAAVVYEMYVQMGNNWQTRRLAPSATPYGLELSAGPVPPGLESIAVGIRIDITGDVGSRNPGVYVDGAHLHVKRTGSSDYAKWRIPADKNRGIRTKICLGNLDSDLDIYEVASDYDFVHMGETYASYIPLLRYINPTLKIYLYESVTSTDYRDSRGVDAWFSNAPLPMGWMSASHPEWLYSNGAGWYLRLLAFPTQYFTRLSNSAFQAEWASRARDKAARWRFDGVWIDDLIDRRAASSSGELLEPGREPWEVQQFIHGVIPVLRRAGLEVVVNSCARNLESGPGQVYYDPFWYPTAPYAGTDYSRNSLATVPTGFDNEWAFWKLTSGGPTGQDNVYDKQYWLRSLADMDAVRRWNSTGNGLEVGPKDQRTLCMLCIGTDTATDPTRGVNGWLQFGLTSYLLGQSEWTMFAFGMRSTLYTTYDLSISKRLGAPSGDHQAYNGDQYVRYRDYAPIADGGVGGVVVVNGHHDQSETYQVGFNAVDESGTAIPAGTTITLKPHTGRILLKQVSNIDVSISIPDQQVAPGQTVTATVTYSNAGGGAVSNVVVRTRVPDGMSYVAGSAEASGGSFDPAANMVSWSVGTVAAGGTGNRTFSVRVD